MSDPRIGTELAGYRIEELIGRGGMGVVYRAEHLRLGRKVALKLLTPELAENEGFRERFESESRLAAAIDHPHIIPLYEAGDAEGLLFLTMRFVDGSDLKALLQREGPLGLERALLVAAQLGGALDAAHERGLVHRDVKPANVLVASGTGADASVHCYLTDFGLTKDTSEAGGLTGTGQFVGTIAYVAPEQIDGTAQGGATDQYALGCVLYECLTGHQPFERNTELDVMWAHLNDDPPSVTERRPDLPPALDDVLARAMAKAPEDRHATCTAMVLAARQARADPTVVGRTVVSPAPADVTRVTPQPGAAPAAAPAAPAAPAGLTRHSPSPAAPSPERARGKSALVAAVAAAVVVGAGAGVVAGGSGEEAPAEATNVAATGGLSLRFPAGWETLSSPPDIPGLELADRIAIGPRASAGREGLIAGRIADPGAKLLPEELAGDADPPARDAVRLGDAEAFRYPSLRPAGFPGVVTLYVLLTDRGRAAIACFSRSPSPRFDSSCAGLAASLELTGAEALALEPSAEYAKAVSDLLTALAGGRADGRKRLAEAGTSVTQASAAAALAATYSGVQRKTRALRVPAAARGANKAIEAALGQGAAAYTAAARAARERESARYRAAGREVRRSDQALRDAVGALRELGYAVGS